MTLHARPITHATGRPAYTETLPALPESVGRARRLVRLAVTAWSLEALADDAVLIASELASNAVQHANVASFRITVVRLDAYRVRVAVMDAKKAFVPTPPATQPNAEQGRGLRLVAALAHASGQEPLNWGKRMWADIQCDTPGP
ncbi:ATP-binding protein [Streptomyces sp. NPDC091204]|uniref:ATP-binding protein n=1 Tax=Streptomyces sp. NPDC091204 TaxID=3155299 RepID=UPI00343544D6